MRRPLRRIFWASCCLWAVLSGCAAPPQRFESGEQFKAPPARWTAFDVEGRIAARKEPQSFSGGFRWQHEPQRDEIELVSPLGQTVARFLRDGKVIRFESGGRAPIEAPDWSSLTERTLGWSLPVEGLVFWVQAAPSPAAPFRAARDGNNRLSELHQQGWVIRYPAYDAQDRPVRIELEYEQLAIRLLIDNWDTSLAVSGMR